MKRRALLFLLTIGMGSSLLFLVQPLCARMILPILGGAPAVWTTCMLFFQAGLLAGYAYAHLLPLYLGHRAHAALHITLLAAAGLLLPVAISSPAQAPEWPALWLLGSLAIAVGLPYVLLASNAPLLQRWFGLVAGRDPYYLYAASNLGSFAGLLAYPFLLEPNLYLSDQGVVWAWGYWPLTVLTGLCALPLLMRQEGEVSIIPDEQSQETTPPNAWQKGRWVLLAMVPSSLMLSVTSYLTSDIAPLPLFWVIPLSIYLLTFVLAFARRQLVSQSLVNRTSPIAVIAILLLLLREANEPIRIVFALHLAAFALLAQLCHGELARTRPNSRYLTSFYLWLSLGGVLGGILNGLVAPALFPGLAEYPLMLLLAMALRPRREEVEAGAASSPRQPVTRGDLIVPTLVGLATLGLILVNQVVQLEPAEIFHALVFVPALLVSYVFHERPLRLTLCLAAMLLASIWQPSVTGTVIHRERSFFGVHRVVDREGLRYLFHGNTIHGCQDLSPLRRSEPLTYYSRESPVGRTIAARQNAGGLPRVGLVGLGAGTLAAYAREGEDWTFFEIDPVVIGIAEDPQYFTYLRDARARGATVSIVPGDARLTLRAQQLKFDVLVLDAFGSDSIPVHLLTREAFQEYRQYLAEDGVIVLNISNRYVALQPVLANLAEDLGATCLVWRHEASRSVPSAAGKSTSVWAFLSWSEESAALARKDSPWRKARPSSNREIWRDEYANLLPFIHWDSERED